MHGVHLVSPVGGQANRHSVAGDGRKGCAEEPNFGYMNGYMANLLGSEEKVCSYRTV